jgi:peptide/nickel transport system substrate-binding protein
MIFTHRRYLLLLAVLLLIPAAALVAGGQGEEEPEEEEVQVVETADEGQYIEHPVLSQLVSQGALPPIEERLPVPSDVMVVEPLHSAGRYGGTARVFNAEAPSRPYTAMMLMGSHGPFRTGPDGKPGNPNVFKAYEHNEDFTVWTFYLREGLKWSDGEPLTAQNFYDYWRYDRANSDINPGITEDQVTIGDNYVEFYNEHSRQRTVRKEVVDDHTIRYSADIPYPFLINHVSHYHYTGEFQLVPMHFMMQFHPDIVGEETATAQADQAGFDTWFELYEHFSPRQNQQSTNQVLGNFPPTVSPYVAVSKTQTTIIFERNPYYFKVDTNGRQLPYIDRIIVEHTTDREIINGKIISGEVDFEGFMTQTPDIPLYRQYEDQGGYRTELWNFAANATVLEPNYVYDDPVVRNLFQTKEFRHAMLKAIDRDRINNEVLFDRGRPVRITVLPETKWFKPEYETKHLEYNPERSMELLDQIGVTDKDGDGWRDDADGNPISWDIEFVVSEAPRAAILEIVRLNLREIGLNVNVQQREANLGFERSNTNDMAMWVWHGDARTDTLFPAYVNSHIFPTGPGSGTWIDWWNSDGEEGVEPPEEAKEIYEAFFEMDRATSEEEVIRWGQVMLDNAAENAWRIGTVNDFPHPMIVKNDLMNFPTSDDGPLFYIWSTWWTNAYEPSQFYFEARPEITFEETRLKNVYPVDERGPIIERALENGWL